jgi:hypothetical protein
VNGVGGTFKVCGTEHQKASQLQQESDKTKKLYSLYPGKEEVASNSSMSQWGYFENLEQAVTLNFNHSQQTDIKNLTTHTHNSILFE